MGVLPFLALGFLLLSAAAELILPWTNVRKQATDPLAERLMWLSMQVLLQES